MTHTTLLVFAAYLAVVLSYIGVWKMTGAFWVYRIQHPACRRAVLVFVYPAMIVFLLVIHALQGMQDCLQDDVPEVTDKVRELWAWDFDANNHA